MSPEINNARKDRKLSRSDGELGNWRIDRSNVGTQHITVISLSCAHSTNFRAFITVLLSAIQTRAPHSNGTRNSFREKSNDNGADWLVMGAYGHSRLREFFLGGATRGILASMTLPVFMTH